MSDLTQHEKTGGTAIHVGDCYIWAEIYYLDSPTDYREFLPNNDLRSMRPSSKLVMLDDLAPFRRSNLNWFLAASVLAGVVLSLVALIPGS
jgi:hypothetical protein